MSNMLDKKIKNRKESGEGVLITYFPLGEPGIDPVEMAEKYFENGVDVLEVGFPVKAPFLDGPIIAGSMERILGSATFSIEWFFDTLAIIKEKVPELSLELFSYSQLFSVTRKEKIFSYFTNAGIDSILITDLDKSLKDELDRNIPHDIYNLCFVPFHYSDADIINVNERARGYIFYQALDGKTGPKEKLNPSLGTKIQDLKTKIKNIPICIGFGISTPEHCNAIMSMGGDGIIVGSLMVRTLNDGGLKELGRFIKSLRQGLNKN